VHFAGLPSDMEKVYRIAKKYKLIVIEDACHALGAKYKSKSGNNWIKIGSCKHSDMVIFSFHPVKSITTAEGGAILTNNKKFYKILIKLRNHGITKDRKEFKINKRDGIIGEWFYQMQYLGFNYRITDIGASLGISQLKKIEKFIREREKIAKIYNENFYKLQEYIELPYLDNKTKSSWHLYVVRLKSKKINNIEKIRNKIFSYLRKKGIGVQVHYIPVYWHPYYKKLGYKKGICPLAEDYYKRCITLPLYPSLKRKELKKVIKYFKEAIKNFLIIGGDNVK
jgi:dTDP-4-amino-4,6-dideoxygalactose transaminase